MNFRQSSKGRGGNISDPKNYIAFFYIGDIFDAQSQCIPKKSQCDFLKMRGGGGGESKAVWNFSENSSVLVV